MNLSSTDESDFNIQNQTDLLDTLGSVTQTLTIFLGAIAGISLLVGGIGIMNIMLVSVTERTKEIGLRKAVGATRNQILSQFLIETMTLSILGGIIGILFGVAIALLFYRDRADHLLRIGWFYCPGLYLCYGHWRVFRSVSCLSRR